MSQPALVVFDLDGTLINADCAQDWLTFLKQKNWPGACYAETRCAAIMESYTSGQMDMQAYMAEWVKPIMGKPVHDIEALAEEFAFQTVNAHIFVEGIAHVTACLQRGDIVILISASPSLVVHPIARLLGIKHAIGIDVAIDNGQFTSQVVQPFSFGAGKLLCLEKWLQEHQLAGLPLATMYSDSRNDLPLLNHAQKAIVVNADPFVTEIAKRKNWEILSWRTA